MELVLDYTRHPGPARGPAGQLLACFQTFLGHELPNRLVPVQGYARLLAEQDGAADEEGRLLAGRIAELTRKADTLARRLAEIGRLMREPAFGPACNLEEVAAEVVVEA